MAESMVVRVRRTKEGMTSWMCAPREGLKAGAMRGAICNVSTCHTCAQSWPLECEMHLLDVQAGTSNTERHSTEATAPSVVA